MKMRIGKRISSFRDAFRYYARGLYKRFSDENILFLASGVAFSGILCLIPFLLLLTSLIGFFIHQSIVPIQKIEDVLSAIFPPQPYAQDIKVSILGIIKDIETYRSTFGYTGIIILIWASAAMFSSIRIVLNRIYHLKPKKLVVITYVENLLFCRYTRCHVYRGECIFLDFCSDPKLYKRSPGVRDGRFGNVLAGDFCCGFLSDRICDIFRHKPVCSRRKNPGKGRGNSLSDLGLSLVHCREGVCMVSCGVPAVQQALWDLYSRAGFFPMDLLFVRGICRGGCGRTALSRAAQPYSYINLLVFSV